MSSRTFDLASVTISNCSSALRSVYQTINLTDVEDFKARAPADLTTAEVLDNPHALQLARLRFELSERKRFVKA